MTKGVHWTPRLDRRLRELFDEGMPYRTIALAMSGEFNLNFTRNACIGRSNRLRFPLRELPSKPRKPIEVKNLSVRPRPRPPVVKLSPPPPGTLTLMQLTRHTCHWPTGDKPPYTYCGEQVTGEGPFCAAHAALAYQKSRAS
jgi:hypothetical protein